MRSSWLFPPRTGEVQFDEKWSFVDKKQKNCDPADPADDHKGDWWHHVAYDPEHRLVLAVVPGARSIENAEEVVAAVKGRTDSISPRLMTSDEYPAYASAIEAAFGVPAGPTTGPGRRPILPQRRLPQGLTYATVHKEREHDRVVAVERRLIFGTEGGLKAALGASPVSRAVNTSFVERQHGTDRGQNARKARKTTGSVRTGRFTRRCPISRSTATTSAGWFAPYGSKMTRAGGSDGHPRWPPG